MIAALCLSTALTNAAKRSWAYMAQGVGLFVGLLVLAVLVQPWYADDLYTALFK